MYVGKDLLEITSFYLKIDVFNILNKFRFFVLIIRKYDVGFLLIGCSSRLEIVDLDLNRIVIG